MPTVAKTKCDIALFGAQGDLALRKLFPALYQLDKANLLAPQLRVLGLARSPIDQENFLETVRIHLCKFIAPNEIDEIALARFLARLFYIEIDFTDGSAYHTLHDKLCETNNPLVCYFATPAAIYGEICQNLSNAGCIDNQTRIVLEKPIGYDLASSKKINDAVAQHFAEEQIYRIDHYLGKETVQNLIALRFANSLFGSQWDHNHIDHIEITVAETIGIEHRWGYFDRAGQLRDMVQNHLLQLLCLIAMDPPNDLSADSIRDEKVKVLKALKPIDTHSLNHDVIRGQYCAGSFQGQLAPGYLEEPEGKDSQSCTETFVAIKAQICNWRWANVPFYLRTGKRMTEKLSQIIIHFKRPPHYIFAPEQRDIAENKLIIRLQPDEGISLQVLTKDQGLEKGMRLKPGPLKLNFSDTFHTQRIPDAYERLFLEVIQGSQYLFVRRDEIEYAWVWCDQIINGWQSQNTRPQKYPAGSWGPVSSIAMITRDGKSWHEDSA
ncbi:glucose-6-phosphate dehydrogenase [Zooshikella ganghwensis]|uniref:glucose-6-phosphate dehydrogenase n=1 Tax=Zooshikella ganghwensis TaxID=202772 RepID=UPI00041600B5|nr:glucose-6-phosphate dehydrogenase [Zooshikella ganghwensis]